MSVATSANRALAPTSDDIRTRGAATGWGWLPALSLVSACGLFGVSLAYSISREGGAGAELMRWIGIVFLFVPPALRLLAGSAARRERCGLLLLLALELYLVKVLYSPLEFKFVDEFQHLRNSAAILDHSRLFTPNPVNSATVYYPGLSIATSALASVTGLTIVTSGMVIIGVARLILTLALYLLYERLSQSAQVAGLASIIYMCNPHYQFFLSMFVYQSLALPLAAFTLWIIARGLHASRMRKLGVSALVVLSTLALVGTHHVTNLFFGAFLLLWMLLVVGLRRYRAERLSALLVTTLALALTAGWLLLVADEVLGYLARPLTRALNEVVWSALGSTRASSTFYLAANPLWEQISSLLTVGCISLLIMLGLLLARKAYARTGLGLALAVASLGYFALLALRLATAGAELAGRATAFVFVAVAWMAALLLVEVQQRGWFGRWLPAVQGGVVLLLFIGSITMGYPSFWGRLPGPYLPSAFERSVEPEGVLAAEWTRGALGSNNRIVTDHTNSGLMGGYGFQQPLFKQIGEVMTAPTLGKAQRRQLRWLGAEYVVADLRLTRQLPMNGRYYEIDEPGAFSYTQPLAAAALNKFDERPDVSRVFDSGDIVIYDVRNIDEH